MAALTPAELATLLGPQSANKVKIASVPITVTNRWDGFSDRFAKLLTARLRPIVRAAARVQPSGAVLLKAEVIQKAIGQPEISEVWQTQQSDEPLAMKLSLPLVAGFVDRLLGGGSESIADPAAELRSLSETDRQLASRLSDAIRQSFVEAIQSKNDAESCRLDRISTALSEAWLSDCELVRLTFDVRFVQGAGSFDLLLSVDLAESLADQLTVAEKKQRYESESDRLRLTDWAKASRVTVRLAQTSLSPGDLNNLAIGDVLLTEADAGQPCEVLIDDRVTFLAEAGQLDGQKAARLLQAISG